MSKICQIQILTKFTFSLVVPAAVEWDLPALWLFSRFQSFAQRLALPIDWQLPRSNSVLQINVWAEICSRCTNQWLERRFFQAAPPNANKKGIVVQTLGNINVLLAAQIQRRTTNTNSHKKLVTAGAPPPLVYLKTLMINATLSPDIQLYYSKKTCELISKNRIASASFTLSAQIRFCAYPDGIWFE